jgi:hypothetical protein
MATGSPSPNNLTGAAAAAAAAAKKVAIGSIIVKRPAKKEFHLLSSSESDDLFVDIHEACVAALAAIQVEEEESKEKQKTKEAPLSVKKKGPSDPSAEPANGEQNDQELAFLHGKLCWGKEFNLTYFFSGLCQMLRLSLSCTWKW